MARKFRKLLSTGTFANVCIYEMNGKTCIRSKSSLTRKRVLKGQEFEKTRKHASDLGCASRIGSAIYQALPKDIKERWLYQAITGEAASLLYAGNSENEVKAALWKKYVDNTDCRNGDTKPKFRVRSTAESNRQLREVFQERWQAQALPPHQFKHAWKTRSRFNPKRFRQTLEMAGLLA